MIRAEVGLRETLAFYTEKLPTYCVRANGVRRLTVLLDALEMVLQEAETSGRKPRPETLAVMKTARLAIKQSERTHRTLIRVVEVRGDTVRMVIPGWDAALIVERPLDIVPQRLHASLEKDFRVHARVNIGASSEEELVFHSWEDS